MVPNTQHEPNSLSLPFVEDLYADYQQDSASVPQEWRAYFEQMDNGHDLPPRPGPGYFDRDKPCTLVPGEGTRCRVCGRGEELGALQHRVDKLIRNYRVRGHRVARLNPLGKPDAELPELDPAYHGFTDDHMNLSFSVTTMAPEGSLTLREIVHRLQTTYSTCIGVQFMHIDDIGMREWLQERMERVENHIELTRDEQVRIFTRLTDAVIFEDFIQKKYVGAKRFSLEGAESLIPLLDLAIERAGEQGMDEIVIGMAHRGRLNVLANVMGKSPRMIFREFEDIDTEANLGRGDVKYHLGYHNDWMTACGKQVHLALCFNASHLEFVNPVAMGRVRAKQDRLDDVNHERGMTLLIHGDAAFIGEGVVQETLNLSQLPAYTTGGTLHVVVNNQIGFTTAPAEGRSTQYATDVAKMLQIPIFHVNGEDPEAVAQVIGLAMEFRRTFQRDVVIDMYCYRRHGHNETDEPAFTHPNMYKAIKKRKSVRDAYLGRLLKIGEITQQEADNISERRRQALEDDLAGVRDKKREAPKKPRPSILGQLWKQYEGGFDADVPEADTGVPIKRLRELLESLGHVPDGFTPHPKIKRLLETRLRMARGEKPLDWGAAEMLALATLAVEGARIRMSGQDSARGTFSHRHALLYDYKDGHMHAPLQTLSPDQAPAEILNSPLSEVGVLGFEYGFSIAYPDGLTVWEAQFGDFCNAAQVMIDQGITSAEDKWNSLSGLVLLLPHGFEGMGPEHSSARLERFLSLGSEDNIQVVVPSTPAQYFHCLRRQVVRPWRKPLVVMTPKSGLRNPRVVSDLADLASGQFQRVLPDTSTKPADITRILMCCGKISHELEEQREKRARNDVAILKVEQLYPLQEDHLRKALAPYGKEVPVVWVQEEPENMGAWLHLHGRFWEGFFGHGRLRGIYRDGSASPATGSASSHRMEQEQLYDAAFGEE
ncbi:MAG: 2-oxoglutarate dehydrogenase E1 component [bacterium]|nr:2-oxoglutarate dehydrogenase E1 component [bacterium]